MHDFAECDLPCTIIFLSVINEHTKYLGMQNVQRDHMIVRLQFLLLQYKTGS
jgi:hypothetical protein